MQGTTKPIDVNRKPENKLMEIYQDGNDLVMVASNLNEERKKKLINRVIDFCINPNKDYENPEAEAPDFFEEIRKMYGGEESEEHPAEEQPKQDENEAVNRWEDRKDSREAEGGSQLDPERYLCEFLSCVRAPEAMFPDPVLIKLADLAAGGEWVGTPTELFQHMPVYFKTPCLLTRYLNLRVKEMFDHYGLLYQSGRNHKGRYVRVKKASDFDVEMIRFMEKAFHLVSSSIGL